MERLYDDSARTQSSTIKTEAFEESQILDFKDLQEN
jgi:hypothetical protein